MKKVLAIDMGATSIRGILAYIENDKLVTREVMRTAHTPIVKPEGLFWDFDLLLDKIVATVIENADDIDSVAVDTWGVDFGILAKDGKLLFPPRAYRDPAHEEAQIEFNKIMSNADIYMATGNQVMPLNTIFQLAGLQTKYPDIVKNAGQILMLPDLLKYFLCGGKSNEETMLSTSQLYDIKNKQIAKDICKTLEIDEESFLPIIRAGQYVGSTAHSPIEALRKTDVSVYSVCGHDTASAILVTEALEDDETLFLSCGTWSLLGVVTPEAIVTAEGLAHNLTNELGYGSINMFFKNITGLYLLEKYKAQLEISYGRSITFAEINEYLQNDEEDYPIIDMDNPVFSQAEFDAEQEISKAIATVSDIKVKHDFAYFKIIYRSLVAKYQETQAAIAEITGKKYKRIHMIGGGAKSAYLAQLIADTLQLEVVAGPVEATALGNIIVQLTAIGELASINDGIKLIKRSENVRKYIAN